MGSEMCIRDSFCRRGYQDAEIYSDVDILTELIYLDAPEDVIRSFLNQNDGCDVVRTYFELTASNVDYEMSPEKESFNWLLDYVAPTHDQHSNTLALKALLPEIEGEAQGGILNRVQTLIRVHKSDHACAVDTLHYHH